MYATTDLSLPATLTRRSLLQQQLLQQQQLTAEQAARLMDMECNHTALKLESERWKQRYYLALDRVGIHSKIPPEMLRRLLWLCHPDRHGDSETATATTAWLLAQRATS